VDVYDPWAKPEEVKHEYGIVILEKFPRIDWYNAIVLAVAHHEFQNIVLPSEKDFVIYDVKGMLDRRLVDARL
jgi:UDP-N-acetyl-D-galactosamine dehydrogenase